jgi:hypothetical protein
MADGTLKVGTITNSAGSGNITIGSGVTVNVNRPAFEAYLSADQSISDATWTKANINTEVFDTDNAYDNSTNYRFTVPSGAAGKYNIYAILNLETDSGHELDLAQSAIYKNGSVYRTERLNPNNSSVLAASVPVYATMDLAVADYIEIYAYVDRTSGGTIYIKETNKGSFFGAYKVGA